MRKLIAAATAATFALSLAACGSDTDADDEIPGDTVEEPADEALSDMPEEAPVAVEPATTTAAEVPETRRRSLEESGARAESAADDIEAALEAEFGDAEDARDAEAD